MKKTLKNYLASELNANVEVKKISYNKTDITRTYLISDNEKGIYEDEVENVIPTSIGYEIEQATPFTVRLKVRLPLETDWKAWEEEVLDFWEPEDEDSFETPEEPKGKIDIEEVINNLKVGSCYIPGVGAGYTSNEKDLENLKHFLRGAMTMAGMMGKI